MKKILLIEDEEPFASNLKEELKGDFSNLQNINSDDSNSIL